MTVRVEGTSAYLLAQDVDELIGTAPTAAVRLLPAFDQYVLGPGTAATEILASERRAEVSRAAGWISPVVVAAGRVAGVWDRDGREIGIRLFDDADGYPPAGGLDLAIERMSDVLLALDLG